jgi:transcriptional regulator with XRE-family HTH domain
MFKNRVREIRKLRKMTLEELAEKLNVSYSAIQKLDAGTVDLDTQWIRKLSVVLDVKPYELLPLDMQPEEITPEEREILRMIRKSTTPQGADNNHIPSQASVEKHTPQPSQPPHKSNER